MKNNRIQLLALTVGSYNIKAGSLMGRDMSVFADDIVSLGLDIVGLQEIDKGTARSGGIDTARLLSEATGYKYYRFTRAIDYQGGQYGTAILSRHPIKSFETIALFSGDKEGRSVGHAVIDYGGIDIDFLNTHLSYESAALREKQFNQLAARLARALAERGAFILVGDFNTSNTSDFAVIKDSFLVNNNAHATFPSTSGGIDNIVLSTGWSLLDAGMGPAGRSDHNMLWAKIEHSSK